MIINKKYILSPLLLGSIVVPIFSIACSSSDEGENVFEQGRDVVVTYKDYNTIQPMSHGRIWDMSVQPKNKGYIGRFEAITPMLFKTRVKTESKVQVDKSGQITLKTPRQTQTEFDAISEVIIDAQSYTNYEDMKIGFINPTNKMVFKIAPGTKWINNKGEKTKYEFKAIDFFYGWLRSVYASETVRVDGNIMGKNQLAKLSNSYLQKLKEDGEFYSEGIVRSEYNNSNAYLFNLFNVDIQETIVQNTGANENKDEFTLMFDENKTKIDVVLGLLANKTLFTAVSSEKIEEMRGPNINVLEEPGKYIQLGEYGTRSKGNNVDLSNLLLVSRYYFEQFNIDPKSTGIIMKKNKYSYDKTFNDRKNTINKYQILTFQNEDVSSFYNKRKVSFLKDNSESILYKQVETNELLMKEIQKTGTFKWTDSDTTGLIWFLSFNPLYMLNDDGEQALKSNAIKLLFNANSANAALTSSTADDEYFLGRGRRFRALLNASLNLKAISDDLFPKSDEIKTTNTYFPKQPLILGSSESYFEYENTPPLIKLNTPIYSATDSEMAKHVQTNANEGWKIKYKTTQQVLEKVKKGWKQLVEDAGLKLTDEIIIPLYDYKATDIVPTQTQTRTYQNIIASLNEIVKDAQTKIKFVPFVPTGNKAINNYIQRQSAPLTRVLLGADYRSAASIIHQLLGSYYGNGIGAQLLAQILDTNLNNNLINKDFIYDDKFDFTQIKQFISKKKQKNPSRYTNLTLLNAKNMTMRDWSKFRTSTFDKTLDLTKIKFFEELDEIFSKFFKEIVATNKNLLIKWSQFETSLAFANKLSVTEKALASIATPYIGESTPAKKYQSNWMHLALGTAEARNDFQLVDSYIDIDEEI